WLLASSLGYCNHGFGDAIGQRKRCPAIVSGHPWSALLAHSSDEVFDLTPQRFFFFNRQVAAGNRRLRAAAVEPERLDLLLGVIDRDVGIALKDAQLAHAIAADAAGGEVGDAAGRELQAHV